MDREHHVSSVLKSYSESRSTDVGGAVLMRSKDVAALASAALRAASVRLIVSRRRYLCGYAESGYDDAAEQVRTALEGAVLSTASRAFRRDEGSDEETRAIESKFRGTTDATARARLIRERAAIAARDRRAEADREARRACPVTDVLLDARSVALIENLRSIVQGPAIIPHDVPEFDNYYHRGDDPLRWYD